MIETYSYQAFVQGYMKYMNVSEEQALSYVRKAGELAVEAKNRFLKENPSLYCKKIYTSSFMVYLNNHLFHLRCEYRCCRLNRTIWSISSRRFRIYWSLS